ncbi:Protein Spindly [Coemansia spiralis]|nr:Protein Spindly [Coemansia spiralis]
MFAEPETPTRAGGSSQPDAGSPQPDTLRDRLREAYGLLKEKERDLFLAATVGQELVDANQQLQTRYDKAQRELAQAQRQLRELGHASDGDQAARLHGRRRSMHQRQGPGRQSNTGDDSDDAVGERERLWTKTHVQPLRAQLQMAQERMDELLVEREELGAEVHGLRQELAAALRRAGESAAAAADAQQRSDQLAEDNARLQTEAAEQRAFWAQRWAEHQGECQAGEQAQNAQRSAEDTAARLRAEQRAGDLRARHDAVAAENERLRRQLQSMEEKRTSEWEPIRERWLASEEALQELQEAHHSTCEALAQAETRLAERDKGALLNDPIKARTEKTSTSLLGELDVERHKAVSEQRAMAHEHTALKRAYGRALSSQSRMKQQVTRLTQLAATGASEARMRRLEAALGEAECQQQVLLWANADHRRPVSADSGLEAGSAEADGAALVVALRARLKQAADDCAQTQRELRTAHLLRANEIQKSKDLERNAADAEAKLRHTAAELMSLRAENERLKRAARAGPCPPPADNECPGSPLDDGADMPAPPRKRTSSGAGLASSRSPPRTGPVFLSLVDSGSGTAKRHRGRDSADAEEAAVDSANAAEGCLPPPAATEAMDAGGDGGGDGGALCEEQAEADVTEIHVGGGRAQQPIECNNQ